MNTRLETQTTESTKSIQKDKQQQAIVEWNACNFLFI